MRKVLLTLLALSASASALTIKIDYTYDTNGFFTPPARRSAMEAVAKFYGDLIKDNLLRINTADFPSSSWSATFKNPQTGVIVSLPNFVVPEDTIIVYVGARSLGAGILGSGGFGGFQFNANLDFLDRILGRGNLGAISSPVTDHAPWGGSIAFDTTVSWNFSQSVNSSGFEFISVALHEMGHVLGIGVATSWTNKIVAGKFTGAASVRSYGSAPPVQSNNGHFDQSTLPSLSFGSFGRPHGQSIPVNMIPNFVDNGSTYFVASDLDLAALVDCGWEISPPLNLSVATLSPSAASFTLNSSSFLNYVIQRSDTLVTFSDFSGPISGNGTVKSWADPSPLVNKGFYRLHSTRFNTPLTTVAKSASLAKSLTTREDIFYSMPPMFATGCYCKDHQ